MRNWKDISFLKDGNNKQSYVYSLLKAHKILDYLEDYHPIVVGTIPIGIDTPNSDIDIICQAKNLHQIKSHLKDCFETYNNFKVSISENVLTCNFLIEEIEAEIYVTNKVTILQNGYRHMVIEHRMLNLLGEDFFNEIMVLKNAGTKTEPAFVKLIKLEGNPYDSLLKLENLSDDEIINLYNHSK